MGTLINVQSECASADDLTTAAQPLLQKYCVRCHGTRTQEGKVDLSLLRDEASLELREEQAWAVIEQLRGYAMPPSQELQPTEVERTRLLAIFSATMNRIDARRPPRAGRVPLRRLNRVEYQNTLRDLLGIELELADHFPADDTAHGFDNVADGLSLSPLLFEKYLAAAEQALDHVVVDDPHAQLIERRLSGEELQSTRQGGKRNAGGNSNSETSAVELRLEQEIGADFDLPSSGQYLIRVQAWRTCEANEPATLVLKVGNVDTKVWSISAGEEDRVVLDAQLPLSAGVRRISVRHTWHTANVPKDVTLPEIQAHVEFLEVKGPLSVAAHRQLFAVDAGEGVTQRDAAQQILDRFATRAFRRPVETLELDRLLALYDRSRQAGRSQVAATGVALAAILVSPHFLFHVERDTAHRDAHGAYRLSDWELASRLSYFLWSTMPDDDLRQLAAAGTLQDEEVLRAQVKRMLADPKSNALVENFGGQWLGWRRLDTLTLDRGAFSQFGDSLRRTMQEEGRRFFETILREDRSIDEFVSADWTWMNEELAKIYGERTVKGNEFRRVTLSDSRRGGVITMSATLAMTSLPTRTSAVKRGKWVLEEILGAPPPPPPPNVPELAASSNDGKLALTLRERLERHRADPRCYGCHVQMDALGLGLENFDPLGRWRKQDSGRDIDAAGILPTGQSFSGPAELKQLLSQRKPDFTRCLTEKMFVYALGRGLVRSDRREIQRVADTVLRDNGRFSTLLVEIALSYPFRYREAEQ